MQCWSCESLKDFTNEEGGCDDWTDTPCQGDQDRCAYIYTKQSTVETFTRTCTTKAYCERRQPTGVKVKCCDTEKCNDGVPEFS